MQKSEARIAGHRRSWNPQVLVLASRSTSIPAVDPYMKIQRCEAGCRDVPRCDDPPPGPTIGRLHVEAVCGDVPLCDDTPSGPMRASQNGEAGCGDVPRCDDPPPGPIAENTRRGEARCGDVLQCDERPPGSVRRCSTDSCLKSNSVRADAADRKRVRKVRIPCAREQEELNMVERAILVSDAIAGFC